jgi:hypothetical protein
VASTSYVPRLDAGLAAADRARVEREFAIAHAVEPLYRHFVARPGP